MSLYQLHSNQLYSKSAILPQVVALLVSAPCDYHRSTIENCATTATLDLFAKKRKGVKEAA